MRTVFFTHQCRISLHRWLHLFLIPKELAFAFFLMARWAMISAMIMVIPVFIFVMTMIFIVSVIAIMFLPFASLPVTMAVIVSISMPTNHNNRGWSDDNRSWHANIDAHVDGMRGTGKYDSEADDRRSNKCIFHDLFPDSVFKMILEIDCDKFFAMNRLSSLIKTGSITL